MELTQLTAICPLDGRYADKLSSLRRVFSEYGLMYYRLLVEIRWLQILSQTSEITEVPSLSAAANARLEQLLEQFSIEDAQRIKDIEAKTNHDVKALEYFLKEKISDDPELVKISEFIHFACTSEDINNLAYAFMLKKAREDFILPALKKINQHLLDFAQEYAELAMLARTHGQPATPTTLGKEMANVSVRLQKQIKDLSELDILGKLNGATGNFNAHSVAYPEVNWLELSYNFVKNLGFTWNAYTTQIEPHDFLAEHFHALMRINTILIGLSRDIWGYISLNYLSQKSIETEVGSSTMPHKINPIDFENAEGNLGMANALFAFMADKLPISRWQRDLSDSTVLRNMGVCIGYSLLAYQSLLKGLSKITANSGQMLADLQQNSGILAEAIQTVMRRYGIDQPYEKLKELTRGKEITQEMLINFIDGLDLPHTVKNQLKQLRPETYLGVASQLAKALSSK